MKRLVEMHHGQVTLASPGVGHGTEVTIQLPLSGGAGDPGPPFRDPDNTEHDLSELTILLVEDTEDALDATRVMLEMHGAQVLVARNGREALDALAVRNVDLVLCDLRMPVMDGFEFLAQLSRSAGADAPPVLAMTGLATAKDIERTRGAGFAGHLKKPFDEGALISMVRSTFETRHTPRTGHLA